jgi:3,4-dihydroxy 2-butanone 4-phosphate synthase/GTP cyclohydrolase II
VTLGEGTLVTFSDRVEGPVVRQDFPLPVHGGEWRASVMRVGGAPGDYMAVWLGDLDGDAPLVRLHSECRTGDVFRSTRCDCGAQRLEAERRIQAEGRGIVLYLPQEGRGIGLLAKAAAYALQDGRGLDTCDANLALGLPADARDYTAAARILRDLGVGSSVRLLTNNPDKVISLRQAGFQRVQRMPLITEIGPENRGYLAAKVARMGHFEDLLETLTKPRIRPIFSGFLRLCRSFLFT